MHSHLFPLLLPPFHSTPASHPAAAAAATHRGKNFARTFTHPKCSIPDRYPRSFDKVLALQDKHDPKKIFEPELWQQIRERKPFGYYPRCAGAAAAAVAAAAAAAAVVEFVERSAAVCGHQRPPKGSANIYMNPCSGCSRSMNLASNTALG
jgi:streptogramin lyase